MASLRRVDLFQKQFVWSRFITSRIRELKLITSLSFRHQGLQREQLIYLKGTDAASTWLKVQEATLRCRADPLVWADTSKHLGLNGRATSTGQAACLKIRSTFVPNSARIPNPAPCAPTLIRSISLFST